MSQLNVLPFYEINADTMALIPAKHFDYETIVLEQTQTLYIKQRPMAMIRSACLEGGATYDGRRKAVMHQTGIKHRVPIPINPTERLFAYPTHSPKLYECHWIFYHHVLSITPNSNDPTQSIILFKYHHDPLILDISYRNLLKQNNRTADCVIRFSEHSLIHV